MCPWSTLECSQPAACPTNRSLLVAFTGRPTNSCSTLHRAGHLEFGVIGCHHCITSHSGTAPASSDMRPNPRLCPECIPPTTSIPATTQLHTCTNWDWLVRLPRAALALLRSSSGACGNTTTTTTTTTTITVAKYGSHSTTSDRWKWFCICNRLLIYEWNTESYYDSFVLLLTTQGFMLTTSMDLPFILRFTLLYVTCKTFIML